MGRERILLHPILRFTGTHLLSEKSRKCLLCKLQYRSKVHRQSQLETRIPILDDFESRVSRIEFWGTVNLLLTGTSDIFENVKTKRDRK